MLASGWQEPGTVMGSLPFPTLASTLRWKCARKCPPHKSSWRGSRSCLSTPSPSQPSAQSGTGPGGTCREPRVVRRTFGRWPRCLAHLRSSRGRNLFRRWWVKKNSQGNPHSTIHPRVQSLRSINWIYGLIFFIPIFSDGCNRLGFHIKSWFYFVFHMCLYYKNQWAEGCLSCYGLRLCWWDESGKSLHLIKMQEDGGGRGTRECHWSQREDLRWASCLG